MELHEKLLTNDRQLCELIDNHIKFETHPEMDQVTMLYWIEYFQDAYDNTNQDTVIYAAEQVVVIRRILQGFLPTKLVYLTDFDGEVKE